VRVPNVEDQDEQQATGFRGLRLRACAFLSKTCRRDKGTIYGAREANTPWNFHGLVVIGDDKYLTCTSVKIWSMITIAYNCLCSPRDRTEAQARAALHAHILGWFKRRRKSDEYVPIPPLKRKAPGTEPRQRPIDQKPEPLKHGPQEDAIYHDAHVSRAAQLNQRTFQRNFSEGP
jgi:hypothetical protein